MGERKYRDQVHEKNMVVCSKCGSSLIGQYTDGTFELRFGRSPNNKDYIPVHMFIQGPIRMRCINKECREVNPDHWNYLDYTANCGSMVIDKS